VVVPYRVAVMKASLPPLPPPPFARPVRWSPTWLIPTPSSRRGGLSFLPGTPFPFPPIFPNGFFFPLQFCPTKRYQIPPAPFPKGVAGNSFAHKAVSGRFFPDPGPACVFLPPWNAPFFFVTNKDPPFSHLLHAGRSFPASFLTPRLGTKVLWVIFIHFFVTRKFPGCPILFSFSQGDDVCHFRRAFFLRSFFFF